MAMAARLTPEFHTRSCGFARANRERTDPTPTIDPTTPVSPLARRKSLGHEHVRRGRSQASCDVHEEGATAEARAGLDAPSVIETEPKIGLSVPPSRTGVPPLENALGNQRVAMWKNNDGAPGQIQTQRVTDW